MNPFESGEIKLPGKQLNELEANALTTLLDAKYYIKEKEPPHYNKSTRSLIWNVFPDSAIPTTRRIFLLPLFQAYEKIYITIDRIHLNHWKVSHLVYESNPQEIENFFFESSYFPDIDYYVFDANLKWVISWSHDDFMIIVGDFKIF